jgi:GNAT superfamily N-acetyltransferase
MAVRKMNNLMQHGTGVRYARWTDVPAIMRIGKTEDFRVSRKIRFYDRAEVHEWVTGRDDLLRVITFDSRIVGFYYGKQMSRSWMMLDCFYICPIERRKGFGDWLMQDLLEQLGRRGVEYVSGLVAVNNPHVSAWMLNKKFESAQIYLWIERHLPALPVTVVKRGARRSSASVSRQRRCRNGH